MNMKVIYEHKNEMTFIGFHTEITPEEGYKKFKIKEFVEFGHQAGFSDITVKRFGSGEILVIVYTK